MGAPRIFKQGKRKKKVIDDLHTVEGISSQGI